MSMSIEWRSLKTFYRSVFTQLNSKVGKKMHGFLWQLRKMPLELLNYD